MKNHIFVLPGVPGVPGEKECQLNSLDSLYGKVYPFFLKE
jgi:hypothetical protein